MTKEFVHLHLHTDYSILDGVSKCTAYLEKAKQLGMKAMAVTDHGNLAAHMELFLQSKRLGIKPIFGCEMYIVDDASIHDKDHRTSEHILLLAKNNKGYENLCKLQHKSWSPENFYFRPRIDLNILREHSEGLIVSTACLKGQISQCMFNSKKKKIKRILDEYKDIFGKDNVYLEIQLHTILQEDNNIQEQLNRLLLKLSEKEKLPLLLTNDVHYLNKGMHKIQNQIYQMRSNGELDSSYCKSIWMKSLKELTETWKEKHRHYISKKQFNEAVSNTVKIAEQCNVTIDTGELKIPKISIKKFPHYDGESQTKYLKKRILIGLKQKIKHKQLSAPIDVYKEQILKELHAFKQMHVVSYLLIYDDLIRFLKSKGCLCSLRGSANGSVVLWLIGVSIVDPIKFNISFDRFISPARIEAKMADIDIDLDISHTYREMAIQYLKDSYGDDKICQVGSYGRTQIKAAIKNMARVEYTRLQKKLGKTTSEEKRIKIEKKMKKFLYSEINKVTKDMPDNIMSIDGLEDNEWISKNKKWLKKSVLPIIGNVYSSSLHPAGIVISHIPYMKWLPVRTNKLSVEKGGDRVFATQWENSHTFEEYLNECGVMVADILGVKTLTIIDETLKEIYHRHNVIMHLEDIPMDDKEVFKSLTKGENVGFFQLGKSSLAGLLKSVAPNHIEDIIFMIAADRPGPIASGAFNQYIEAKQENRFAKVHHSSLKKVLNDTRGVLTYSEHIMRTATEFAGMNPKDGEMMRKIMKSKHREDFEAFHENFVKGAIKKWSNNSLEKKQTKRIAERIWKDMIGFSAYAFPKAHATAYALIANATQYLKVHYSIEFFSKLLKYVASDKLRQYASVAQKEYGIEFVNPHINISKQDFSIEGINELVWPLSIIKGVGQKAAVEIASKQPFSSFEHFFNKVNKRIVNKRVIEILIAANTFREFGNPNIIMKEFYELRKDPKFEDKPESYWLLERSKILPFSDASISDFFPELSKFEINQSLFHKIPTGTKLSITGFITSVRNIKKHNMMILNLRNKGNDYIVVLWSNFLENLEPKQISKIKKDIPVLITGIKAISHIGEDQLTLGKNTPTVKYKFKILSK